MATGLYGTNGQLAAPPYTNGPYTWDQTLTLTGDFSYSGHKDGQILLCNAARSVSTWAVAANGAMTLAASSTAKQVVYPITGLKVGDEIVGFRILGQIQSGGNTATLDADLRKVTKAAADPTDASVGAITQVSVTTQTAVDSNKTLTAEVVAADYQYYVLVAGTTAAATDIQVLGIEVDVNRK